MRAVWLSVILVVVGCERIDSDPPSPPLQAFSDVDWSTPPSDEALVRAMVGTGGTAAEHTEVETLARELLLPVFQELDDKYDKNWYRRCADDFRESKRRDRVTTFALVAADNRANRLHWQALYVAWARAHHELWPTEPITDPDVAAIDPSTIEERAGFLRGELARLRQLVSPRAPWLFDADRVESSGPGGAAKQFIWMLEDNLRIASGGGYERSNNGLHWALVKHGIPTTYTEGFDP